MLGGIRLALILLPFGRVWRALERLGRASDSPPTIDQEAFDRVVGAVKLMGRYVPGVTCLDRALAAKVLLSRRGYSVDLRIGVTRGPGEPLEAHAWLEDDGTIVIGDLEDLTRYTRLPALRPGRL